MVIIFNIFSAILGLVGPAGLRPHPRPRRHDNRVPVRDVVSIIYDSLALSTVEIRTIEAWGAPVDFTQAGGLGLALLYDIRTGAWALGEWPSSRTSSRTSQDVRGQFWGRRGPAVVWGVVRVFDRAAARGRGATRGQDCGRVRRYTRTPRRGAWNERAMRRLAARRPGRRRAAMAVDFHAVAAALYFSRGVVGCLGYSGCRGVVFMAVTLNQLGTMPATSWKPATLGALLLLRLRLPGVRGVQSGGRRDAGRHWEIATHHV